MDLTSPMQRFSMVPTAQGLYDPRREHDACGLAMVATLRGTAGHDIIQAALDALILPLLDRRMEDISPVEHATMWIGVYEFRHCLDVPWRVVLNECIELAKEFGGTDGHKYVNGVLNGVAPGLRAAEVAADRNRKPKP